MADRLPCAENLSPTLVRADTAGGQGALIETSPIDSSFRGSQRRIHVQKNEEDGLSRREILNRGLRSGAATASPFGVITEFSAASTHRWRRPQTKQGGKRQTAREEKMIRSTSVAPRKREESITHSRSRIPRETSSAFSNCRHRVNRGMAYSTSIAISKLILQIWTILSRDYLTKRGHFGDHVDCP